VKSGPHEGIYLDAAIGRMRGEIDDRIDRIGRVRSRLRIAAGLGLSAVLLAGGAGIATALGTMSSVSVITARTTVSIGCDGTRTDADAGFFTATYTLPEPESGRVDVERLCALARERLAHDPGIAERSPVELLVLAGSLVRQADREAASPPSDVTGRVLDVEVLRASFRPSGSSR